MDDEALAAAIDAHVKESAETPGLILTEWIVVAATSGWDEGGDQVTAVTITPSGGPMHHMLGLLDEARTRMRADLLAGYEDD